MAGSHPRAYKDIFIWNQTLKLFCISLRQFSSSEQRGSECKNGFELPIAVVSGRWSYDLRTVNEESKDPIFMLKWQTIFSV